MGLMKRILLKKKNQEVKAAFIGELSGHFFFSADFYNHDDAFVIKILNEIYGDLKISKGLSYVTCEASKPRINPSITPMEEYYCMITEKEYQRFIRADYDEGQKILSRAKK